MTVYPYDRFAEPEEKLAFWDSLRDWFNEREYFLFKFVEENGNRYACATPTRESPPTDVVLFDYLPLTDPFPYAFVCPGNVVSNYQPPFSTPFPLYGQVMFAQDVKGRHVIIRMVKGGSEEYKVVRLLKDQPRLLDPDSFPSVIPILDLLPYNDDWFCITPRWELSLNHSDFFPTFHLAFQHLIFLLEGLAFLHDLRIFHRDIFPRNLLVNHYSSLHPARLKSSFQRHRLKQGGLLRYAIMDFDLSMVLDEETYGPNPRLPIQMVLAGHGAKPYEVAHAHLDFDAFKFDVACLGIYLIGLYGHIIVDVPLLAPLLARMTTPNIDKRFTASEALEFAKTILPTITTLENVERKPFDGPSYYRVDLWAGLPESFLSEWAAYRDDRSSWTVRLKNWLFNNTDKGWYLTYYYRRALRVLTYIPNLMLRPFLSPIRTIT